MIILLSEQCVLKVIDEVHTKKQANILHQLAGKYVHSKGRPPKKGFPLTKGFPGSFKMDSIKKSAAT